MNKRFLFGMLFFAVIGCVIFLVLQSRSHVAVPQSGTTIVVFGDSLVEGIGVENGSDFPSQLEKMIGVPIINAGVAGDTTAEALKRFDADVLGQDPKIVIILLGGNDALQNVSPDTTFAHLETMISRSRDHGAGVILIGVRGGLHNTEYKQRFKELARTYETAYLPDIHKGLFRDKELMTDTVHPNASGYAVIAQRIAPVVKEMLDY